MHEWLDLGSKALAAQDLGTLTRKRVSLLLTLPGVSRIAYGRDALSADTRDTLLHSQLQDGLKYELMKAPAVSGADTYKSLCMAARNEEKRLLELKRRQQYQKATPPQS